MKLRPGIKIGRLTLQRIVGYHQFTAQRVAKWQCVCECGQSIVAIANNLRTFHTRSCGCFQRENQKFGRIKHGHSFRRNETPIYKVWKSIIERCVNPKHTSYKRYGAKGITVCKRWMDFRNFLEDMGPEWILGLTIERIDSTGNYCKENCRWATIWEQARNRSNNHNLTFNGKTQNLSEWSRETGIKSHTIAFRISTGWSIEKALTEPTERMFTLNGETKSVPEWRRRIGLSSGALYIRMKYGWSLEKALTTPVKKTNHERKSV